MEKIITNKILLFSGIILFHFALHILPANVSKYVTFIEVEEKKMVFKKFKFV